MNVNVLVTASGGLVGQGVLRSLNGSLENLGNVENLESYQWTLITGDPDENARGHLLGHKKVQLPMADDLEYVEKVLKVCRDNKVKYVIIGSDTELKNFAVSRDRFNAIGTTVIVSDPTVVEIADDKYLTALWLKQNKLPYPKTISLEPLDPEKNSKMILLELLSSENFKNFPFPAIIKPKNGGRRSYGVTRASNLEELTDLWLKAKTVNVIQEELQGDEFTAGVLVVEGTVKAVCVLRRDLRDGNTFNAYHDEPCDRFIPKLTEIAKALKPEGPCNFQFRVKNDEPVIFEINARFSGTTPLRAMFGFNEVMALLRWHEFKVPIEKPCLKEGKVFRVVSDMLISNDSIEEFPFGVLLRCDKHEMW